jgi:mannosyltransferase
MPREFSFGYPAAFGPLDDLALAKSPSASGTRRGTETDQPALAQRLDGVSRVWLVETGGNSVPIPLADSDLHLAAVYPAGDITIALYER